MIILIECSDQIGLVTSITRIISSYNLNIISMREFVDEQSQLFFARIECAGEVTAPESLKIELEKSLPLNALIRMSLIAEKKIVVLVTKEFHCLTDILVRERFNTLGASVQCVIGNYDNLADITEKFDKPFHLVSTNDENRDSYETQLMEILERQNPDYIILAKFMRVLSPAFVERFKNKIINIHHSFLPAFIGANPYRQAFERGVKIIGATAHFVTNDLDQGPIISQQIVHVNHTFGVKEMVISGREIEKAVLAKALDLVLHDRVFVSGNKTIIFE